MKRLRTFKKCGLRFYKINDAICIYKPDSNILMNIDSNDSFYTSAKFSITNNDEIICIFKEGSIFLLDKNLLVIKKISNDQLKNLNNSSVGLSVIGKNIGAFCFNQEYKVNDLQIFLENDDYILIEKFSGLFISNKYLVHFSKENSSGKTSFYITDIYNSKRYFEYECPSGYQLTHYDWFIWKDYLLFSIAKNSDEGYSERLLKIDILKGNVILDITLDGYGLSLDKMNGKLASIYNKNMLMCYQCFDIEQETYVFGKVVGDISVQDIYSHNNLQTYFNQKVYFTEKVASWSGNKNSPKVGCFNTITLELEFIKEEKQAKGCSFSQIVFNEDKLYVLDTNNTMYEYEI